MRDVAGVPVADASVMVESGSASTQDIAALSDVEGMFVLPGLDRGDYVITARGTDGTSGTATLTVNDVHRGVRIEIILRP